MSWLRNSQVSLVALAVSAAVGLAACGGVESDRESGDGGDSIYANPSTALKHFIGTDMTAFTDAATDGELTSTEANQYLLNQYIADYTADFVVARVAESQFDTDGVKGLSAEERKAYDEKVKAVQAEAKVITDKMTLDASPIPLFAEADFKAFDTNGDGVVKALDFGIDPPADVEAIEVAALTGTVVDLYVRGTLNNWGVDPNFKVTQTAENVYEYDYDAPKEGFIQFKIADANWSAINCGAKPNKADLTVTGKGATGDALIGFVGECGGSSPDSKIYLYKAKYRIKVDMSGAAPLFWVTKIVYKSVDTGNAGPAKSPVDLYVRGSITTWEEPAGNANALVWSDALSGYSLSLNDIEKGSYEFKIADNKWAVMNCGAETDASATVALNTDVVGICSTADGGPKNLKLALAEKGNYTVSLTLKKAGDVYTPTFKVVKQ